MLKYGYFHTLSPKKKPPKVENDLLECYSTSALLIFGVRYLVLAGGRSDLSIIGDMSGLIHKKPAATPTLQL